MTPINGDRDELSGAFVWSTWNPRDPELTSPYGDNNPPVGDTPKTWGDMSDEEKGALLLAANDGKEIEGCVICFCNRKGLGGYFVMFCYDYNHLLFLYVYGVVLGCVLGILIGFHFARCLEGHDKR